MWPPIPSVFLFARETMAMAFQRTKDFILRSIALFPGKGFCSNGCIVFMNGVLVLKGILAPWRSAKSISFSNKNRVLSGPCSCSAPLIDSIHSCVSSGSVSWWELNIYLNR